MDKNDNIIVTITILVLVVFGCYININLIISLFTSFLIIQPILLINHYNEDFLKDGDDFNLNLDALTFILFIVLSESIYNLVTK